MPIILLHIVTFAPSIIFNSLYLVFGDNTGSMIAYMDDIAIWLVAYGTANAAVVTLATGFLFFTFSYLRHITNFAYFLMLVFYTGYGLYTGWFQVTKGVKVIQSI